MRTDGAKNFEFTKMVTEWGGYNSARDKTNIAENLMVSGSQNIYKTLSGTLAVRPGQKRRGVANSAQSPCSSKYVWNTSWGATYTFVISEETLYVIIDDIWYELETNLTKTRYIFDKWWDNTEKKDRVLFVNGTSSMFHWSGGFAEISSTTTNTITKTGSTSWQQSGFSTTSGEKEIVINGTTYTYTGGENTTTLTGVLPDPSSEPNGSTVLQKVQVESNTPASDFNIDFIKIINNQVYVGSYTSRLCYISSATDFKDYVVPTPRAPGDPELLTLDATLKGFGVRQGRAHIGYGASSWAVISFSDITVGSTLTQRTNVDVKPVAFGQAPYSHEFIDNVGDNIIYLDQTQQVRSFGDFNNLFTSGYPSLSQEIATELSNENFTGGSLSCVGEYMYLSAPASGKTYIKQEKTMVDEGGQVVAERFWFSPFTWNITGVADLNGVLIGFSNANPQIYELWNTGQWFDDSPSDEPLPYKCVLTLGYRSNNRRQGLQNFDKLFTEGYIAPGTELECIINYDFNGATEVKRDFINSINRPTTIFTSSSASSFGDSSFGEESFGTSEDENILPKFKNITYLSEINCFEYQPTLVSDSVNARWELLALATNAQKTDLENASFIINKTR